MEKNLQGIHPDLMWEFGPAVKMDGHRLVITPESHKELRPLTETILERAPKIKNWEFYPHRLAEDLEMAQQTVEARTGGSLEDVVVEVRLGEHHCIDLCFRSPRTEGEDDQQAAHDAFVAAETLLGEEALDKWIGAIEVGPLPKSARKTTAGRVTLDRLKDTVDALIGSIHDRLTKKPCRVWAKDTEWTLVKLQPMKAEDYPGRLDLFVFGTVNVELFKAMHTPAPFYSERFSNCNEAFAYVKIDGLDGLGGSKFTDRAEIEDAVDAELAKEKLGIHVGGGTGLRYSYIDLALTDLTRGVETVRQVLREGNVPRRSWILFFDADLCGEWVGVHDDTPTPPT
jgi:hypothetical protein